MAHIAKHGDKWRAQVARKGVRKTAVWDTKREATTWAQRLELEIDAGLIGRVDRTFGHAAQHYQATHGSRKRSQKWEANTFARLTAEFGEATPLGSIDQPRITAWRDKRLKTVSGSTVQREANLLKHLFHVARDEWHWLDQDPFRGVKLPAENQPRHQVWKWQAVKRILRAPRAGKTAEMQLAFHIALRTGMRLSEVLQAPKCFDARRRVVVLPTSKTSGRVEVPIGRLAAKLIARAKFTVTANEGSVLFGILCREMLIGGLTFHDSRATALTLLARKVDVLTLAKISRHKDLRILQSVYYRETAEQIAARL